MSNHNEILPTQRKFSFESTISELALVIDAGLAIRVKGKKCIYGLFYYAIVLSALWLDKYEMYSSTAFEV